MSEDWKSGDSPNANDKENVSRTTLLTWTSLMFTEFGISDRLQTENHLKRNSEEPGLPMTQEPDKEIF